MYLHIVVFFYISLASMAFVYLTRTSYYFFIKHIWIAAWIMPVFFKHFYITPIMKSNWIYSWFQNTCSYVSVKITSPRFLIFFMSFLVSSPSSSCVVDSIAIKKSSKNNSTMFQIKIIYTVKFWCAYSIFSMRPLN